MLKQADMEGRGLRRYGSKRVWRGGVKQMLKQAGMDRRGLRRC